MYSKISDNFSYFKGFSKINFFFDEKNIYNSMVYNYSNSKSELRRLDTYMLIQDIENIRKIKIGDVYTRNNIFDMYLRVGGLSIGTDFSMRPDIITYPLPQFSGKVSLPSSIDILSENAGLYSTDLKPGTFEIKDIPVTSPEGKLKVIIRDVLGREQIVEIPYFTHRKLLKKGLSKYSFTAGFVRENYGVKNFDYTNFVSSGSYTFGVNNKLTLEFDGYIEDINKLSFGTSPLFLVPKIGLFNIFTGISYKGDTDTSLGYLLGMGYEKSLNLINLRFEYKNYSNNFLHPPTTLGKIKNQLKAFLSIKVPFIGSFSTSYIERKYIDREDSSNFNLSYFKTIYNTLTFSATYNWNKTGYKSYNAYRFALNMPLGSNHNASLTSSFNKNDAQYTLNINKKNSFNSSIGYNLRFSKAEENKNFLGKFYKNMDSLTGYLDISYLENSYDEQYGFRTGVRGSIIYIDNEIFLQRQINNSFVLVKIEPPVKNAKIISNNKEIGKTNTEGVALVPNISPYVKNEIRIDPSSLDTQTFVDKTIYSFVPLKYHGYLVKFSSKKVNSVRLNITLPNGEFLPVGLRFSVGNFRNVGIIGTKGRAFIENINEGIHNIEIDYGLGKCLLKLKVTKEMLRGIVPHIGTYVCKPVSNTQYAKKDIFYDKNLLNNKANTPKQKTNKTRSNAKKHMEVKDVVISNNSTHHNNLDIAYNPDEFLEFLEFRENLEEIR